MEHECFFTGTSRFQHKTPPCVYTVSVSLLLAQHTVAGKTMGAWGFTVAPATHYRLRKPNPGKHLIDALYLYVGPSTEGSKHCPRNCDSRSQPSLIPIKLPSHQYEKTLEWHPPKLDPNEVEYAEFIMPENKIIQTARQREEISYNPLSSLATAYPTLARLNSFPITVLFNGMHSDVTTIMKVKYHIRNYKNLFSSYSG